VETSPVRTTHLVTSLDHSSRTALDAMAADHVAAVVRRVLHTEATSPTVVVAAFNSAM
jgi:FXSXX-COOH protein